MKNGKQGFLLTLDAMLSLTIIVLAAYSYVMLSGEGGEIQKVSSYGSLGRDYLKVKYIDQWPAVIDVNPTEVYDTTGVKVSEDSVPEGIPFVGYAEVRQYPTPCGCSNWQANIYWIQLCNVTVSKAEADTCLNLPDGNYSGGTAKRNVWVWKE